VFSLIGAGAIHAVFFDVHNQEWGPAGAFFLVLMTVQVGLAVGFVLFSSAPRWLSATAVGVSLLAVAVWAVSRTTGLPFGPQAGETEAVGRADTITVFFELTTLAVLMPSLLRSRGRLVLESARASSYPLLGVLGSATLLLVLVASAGGPGAGHHREAPGRTEAPSAGAGAPGHGGHGKGSGARPAPSRSSGMVALAAVETNAFTKNSITLEAGKQQSIHFVNRDVEAHNISILRPGGGAPPLFSGDVVPAGAATHYSLKRPLERGRYSFVCDLHHSMRGVVRVR
jgi:plastocyanin